MGLGQHGDGSMGVGSMGIGGRGSVGMRVGQRGECWQCPGLWKVTPTTTSVF